MGWRIIAAPSRIPEQARMKPIRQILFVPPAPLVWVNATDAFAGNGLTVETTQTLSSDQIGAGLAEGTWDIGIGVVDNVIAWNDERKAGLKIIAQFKRSTVMRFLCVRSYSTLSDAAANLIAVDSTSNGFVLVLYRALARAGVDWRKCRFERVGGVRQRFEAMQAGKAAAAILVPPFDGMARAQGFKQLWDGAEIAPHYPGVVAAARADWLGRNEAAAAAYVRALKAANEWAARAENRAAARAALVAARYSEDAAERLVRERVPGLAPSRAGWDEVVTLRRECGLLPTPEPRWDDVVDARFLAETG
jgi:ABC-type nitrate/sulfonate/bicarbonate transport system substrate-binding protein